MAEVIRQVDVTGIVELGLDESLRLKMLHADLDQMVEEEIAPTRKFCMLGGECGIEGTVESHPAVGPRKVRIGCSLAKGAVLDCAHPNNPLVAAQELKRKLGKLTES